MIHPRLYEKLRNYSVETTGHGHSPTLPVILYYCRPREEVRRCITHRYGPIKYELPFINAMALDLSVHKLTAIAKEPMVRWITEDIAVSKTDRNDGLSSISPFSGNPPLRGGFSADWIPLRRSRPVSVAIIDTGVALHPDLIWPENRIRAFYDLIGHKSLPYDDDGHGTHITGILCGLARAPRMDRRWSPAIVAIKALDGEGNGTASDILAAMQWILNNRHFYNIRVVNLSLGVAADDDYDSDPLIRGVEALTNHGITVVAAAGNSGPKPGTISSPGVCNNIITVGAADTTIIPPRVASFSGRGPTPHGTIKPDLVAPGVEILSLDSGISLIVSESPDHRIAAGASQSTGRSRNKRAYNPPGYIAQSGTSMAAPFVSRAVAAICERYPGVDPATVKRILLSQVRPLDGEPAEAQGKGILYNNF